MTIKRCKHIIDVNLALLQKLLGSTSGKSFVFENIETHMTFKVSMTTDHKRQLANWLIKDLARDIAEAAHKKEKEVKA